jgi:organic hydroperoxide reductase OsmC/OhrA
MDLRNQESREFRLDLEHVGGYRFASQASEQGMAHGGVFFSDEPDPVGEASAPATPALLGAAIGHCLSASLLEALRHAHLEVMTMTTQVISVVTANPEGLPRIDHVDVVIKPQLSAIAPRARRCEEVFERHCTVTSSVREGIDVRVRVDWDGTTGVGAPPAESVGAEPLRTT